LSRCSSLLWSLLFAYVAGATAAGASAAGATGVIQTGAAPTTAAPTAVPVDGFAFVQTLGGIDQYRLASNGLEILLVPDHSAPVVTFQVTYRVGSRNEVTGTTGATHILEHMMFKGSEGYNDARGNSVKQYLERVGGEYNANTSVDRTTYFATVGAKDLEGYIAIEADRMRRLLLREADRQAEMTVVRNEYERGKNDPDNVLLEDVTAAAYVALPYHHPVIGWLSDIEHVPIEKLRAFYDTFYWPDNATVTVVGDFDTAVVLRWIQRYYGVYPHSPAPIPDIYTEEPAQIGERRLTVKRPGELGSVVIAHKVPNGRDADQPALDVLDAILSSGKSARLYRALVDAGLALSASAGTDLHRDLSLHTLYAQLAEGATQAEVEKALWAEIEKIQAQGVTPAEVLRVQQQYVAADAYRRDGTAGAAAEINEWIAIGDWTLYVRFPELVAAVTAADVQRVARRYFAPEEATVGWFVPVAPSEHAP
jgi:zinc protease